MNIAIETSALTGAQQYRGIGSYTKLLTEALLSFEPNHKYVFFKRGESIPGVDVIHYPYFDPFYLTLPLKKHAPVVVTVHDLIPIVYNEQFPRGLRGELKWQVQKKSLQGAREIITDSKASKHDIQKITDISESNIHVIYLAHSPIFRPIADKQILKNIVEKYKLPPQFILYVGDVNWNKNLGRLLEAFTIAHRSNNDLHIVLVGKSFLDDSLTETIEINAAIGKFQVGGYVHKVGFVDEDDLPSIYSLASLYIQPSLAEGFGLPVLEAMACNCKVVCSQASSLSEIAGPAVLCDPHNIESIVKSIHEALAIPMSSWIKKSSAWSREFSWKKVANQTVDVYKKASGINI